MTVKLTLVFKLLLQIFLR